MLKTEPLGSVTFVAVRMRGLPSSPVPNVAVAVTPVAPLAKRDSLSLIVGAVALWAKAAGAKTARDRLDMTRDLTSAPRRQQRVSARRRSPPARAPGRGAGSRGSSDAPPRRARPATTGTR